MWNPWNRIRATDRMRLVQLEVAVGDLTDSIGLCLERLNRLAGRVTARARIAAHDAAVEDRGAAASPSGDPAGHVMAEPPDLTVTNGEDRAATRERLRELARAKFGGRTS